MNVALLISAGKRYIYKAALSVVLLIFHFAGMAAPPDVPLKAGMVIKKSATIKPGIYKLPVTAKDGEVISIEGDNITVDFQGAVLQGFIKSLYPDQYTGIGLRIKGNNITVKNAVIKGYQTGLIARDCQNLRITGCDLSYNYKQHLRSTLEREDVSDWMSYHTNEKDEWLQVWCRNISGKLPVCTGRPLHHYRWAKRSDAYWL
jgi:predicted transcriptional regulator